MIQFVTDEKNGKYGYHDLVKIMDILRSEGGCPWDREQTHRSVRSNFIEEVYEAVEAIDQSDSEMLKEELGDVLLQVVFHARMSQEAGEFDQQDVTDAVCRKLILRHPHIFGNINVSGTQEVLQNWENIKREEKSHHTYADSVDAVAKSLPSLMRSEKIQSRAAKAGFDWPDVTGAFDKITEETAELKESVTSGDRKAMEDELGDLLFSVVNVSRFLKIDSERALSLACEKFSQRFRLMEEKAALSGKSLDQMSLSEMDNLWNTVKAVQKME